MGVQDGGGVREDLIGNVMVADYEVYAQFLGVCNLFDGLDAAVQDYYELDAAFGCVFYALHRDSVSLVVAAWNVVLDVGVVVLQVFVDQGHGGGAVHVVVAVEHDSFLGAHRGVQAVHGLVHVGHQERVVQV